MTQKMELMPNGAAVAACLASGIGLLVFSLVIAASELSPAVNPILLSIGKLWMPGAAGIGPYSGKETVVLVAWLGSWFVLHRALRSRDVNGNLWLIVFLVMIGTATTLIWPPIWG